MAEIVNQAAWPLTRTARTLGTRRSTTRAMPVLDTALTHQGAIMRIQHVIAALPPAIGFLAVAGGVRAVRAMRSLYPAPLAPGATALPPVHDPALPTAVVLLDHAGTEVSDALLPYQLLAASQTFNVFAVAPDDRPATLTGGLDVVPHLSFAGLRRLPTSKVDLIVVPHLPKPDPRILEWLREQKGAGAVVLSICTGAAVVAAAGLLEGRRATTHWGDIGRLERRFPGVTWVRGVRYVDDGDVAASAGITSGIDATLHMIRRLTDDEAMHRAADAAGYTDLRYLDDPTTEQYRFEAADGIVAWTAAFGRRRQLGVLLEDGVQEAALAATMDTHAATFTARTVTVSPGARPVRTRHGLTLLPRADLDGPLDRVVRPSPGFHDALDDVAALGGRPIARFAAKRLELRDGDRRTAIESARS